MNTETLWTAVGAVVATVGIIYTFMRNFRKDMNENFKEIKDDIKSIDQRLSRLEGAFLERGQWEGRIYSMQKIMKEEQK